MRVVHQGRGEYVVVDQGIVLGKRCLDPLLEGASVGDAAKNPRDVLRVIVVNETVIQLILLGEIPIQFRKERVAMFKQGIAADKIAGGTGSVWRGEKIQQLDGVRVQPPSRQLIQAATGGEGLSTGRAGAEGVAGGTNHGYAGGLASEASGSGEVTDGVNRTASDGAG